jgi:UDP-glucose 4-epimerase
MRRSQSPGTQLERDVVDAETAVTDVRDKHPGVTVTRLRFCNVLGPDMETSHARLLALPAVPTIAGFDPRYQFIHVDDVVRALEFAVAGDHPGIYNVAPDGVLALTEVIGLLGKQALPVLPPWGTGIAAAVLKRMGIRIPPEMILQLRYGRGLDNRRFKAAGFAYDHSTRDTVTRFAEHLRLGAVLRGVQEPYRYEKEVEDFLRWSPSVRDREAHPEAHPEAGRSEPLAPGAR